jgi:hypothetical protein
VCCSHIVRGQAEDSRKAMVDKVNSMESYLSRRAGRLCRQTAGSWNVLDTLAFVIICQQPATRTFHGVLMNQGVSTEDNRGLTSYTHLKAHLDTFHKSLQPKTRKGISEASKGEHVTVYRVRTSQVPCGGEMVPPHLDQL